MPPSTVAIISGYTTSTTLNGSDTAGGQDAFVAKYDTNGNKGVSFGLQNVQILDNDEAWGGTRARAEDEFEPVESAAGATKGDSIFD